MINYKNGVFGILDIDDMENQPLFLLDGGIESRFKEKYRFKNDSRLDYSGYLFQYSLKGNGVYEKDGIINIIKEGEGFFVKFPEKSQYYIEENIENPWEFIYLHFDGIAAIPFLNKIDKMCGMKFKIDVESLPIRMAINFQDKMISGKKLDRYEGGEFLYKFLCELLREIEKPNKNNSIVKIAQDIMQHEYGTIEGIESLAERLGVSFEHFTRSFKSEINITPIQYLTRIRIQSSINDLLNTDDNLENIANRNGFSSGNYFCKVFRKKVGISPTEYRKNRG